MNLYVTLEQLKTYKGIALDDPQDDARLLRACLSATRAWDRWTFRSFAAKRALRTYDHPEGTVLKLRGDLLEVIEVKTQNGAVALESDEFYLKCGGRYDLQPYDRLELRTDKGVLFSFAGTKQQATTVEGIWGFHRNYAEAWEDSGDTVQNSAGLDTTSSALQVDDADGMDWWGLMPRFQVGQLLKIEDEFLILRRLTGEGANTLTVQRAARGTVAAAHDKGTAISIWRADYDVWEQVQELAAYLYDLKDSQVYDVTATAETGMMVIPKGVPTSVKLAVPAYRKREI